MDTSGDTRKHVGDSVEDADLLSKDVWMPLARQRHIMVGRINTHGSKSQIQKVSAVLEREVRNARRAISHLQHQRNLLLPIARLPVEILLRIFMERWQEFGMDERSAAKTWLVVTYVCRTWRSAALDCAGLWTHVPLHMGEQWAQTFITRSKSATLSLTISHTFTLTTSSWQHALICGQVSRVKNLKADTRADDVLRIMDILKAHNPTRLAKLALKQFSHIVLDLGAAQLLQQMPQLREIQLANTSIPWNELPWNRLRSVQISFGTYDSPMPMANFTLFVASLKSATVLECLDLEVRRLSSTTKKPRRTGVTHMSRLRTLSFHGQLAYFQYFSDAVTTPSTTALNISIYSSADETFDNFMLSPLLRARGKHTQEDSLSCIQAMRLSTPGFHEARMEAWRTSDLVTAQRGDIFIDISLELEDQRRELVALCNSVGLESSRELELDLRPSYGKDWRSETIQALLSSAHRVERVHVTDRLISNFFHALNTSMNNDTPSSDADTTHPRASVMLPSLSHIYLTDYSSSSYKRYALPRWIKARATYMPVKVLSFSKSTVHDTTMRALEKIAGLNVELSESSRVFWTGCRDEEDEDE